MRSTLCLALCTVAVTLATASLASAQDSGSIRCAPEPQPVAGGGMFKPFQNTSFYKGKLTHTQLEATLKVSGQQSASPYASSATITVLEREILAFEETTPPRLASGSKLEVHVRLRKTEKLTGPFSVTYFLGSTMLRRVAPAGGGIGTGVIFTDEIPADVFGKFSKPVRLTLEAEGGAVRLGEYQFPAISFNTRKAFEAFRKPITLKTFLQGPVPDGCSRSAY